MPAPLRLCVCARLLLPQLHRVDSRIERVGHLDEVEHARLRRETTRDDPRLPKIAPRLPDQTGHAPSPPSAASAAAFRFAAPSNASPPGSPEAEVCGWTRQRVCQRACGVSGRHGGRSSGAEAVSEATSEASRRRLKSPAPRRLGRTHLHPQSPSTTGSRTKSCKRRRQSRPAHPRHPAAGSRLGKRFREGSEKVPRRSRELARKSGLSARSPCQISARSWLDLGYISPRSDQRELRSKTGPKVPKKPPAAA